MSLMCTSCASNPARSNAAAISTSPLTPCSRRIAMGGRAPRGDERRGHVLGRIEGQHGRDAGIVGVEDAVVFLRARVGVVAQRLHLPGRLAPGPVQRDADVAEEHADPRRTRTIIVGDGRATTRASRPCARSSPSTARRRQHRAPG